MKYSIEVYEDHAIIKGRLNYDVLTLLLKICKKEGFTHSLCEKDGEWKFIRINGDASA